MVVPWTRTGAGVALSIAAPVAPWARVSMA
jgi:hypothetical protein